MSFVKRVRKSRVVAIGASVPWRKQTLLILISAGVAFTYAAAQNLSEFQPKSEIKQTSSPAPSADQNAGYADSSDRDRCSCENLDARGSEVEDDSLREALQGDLDTYLSGRATVEHISAISLSVSLRGQKTINLTTGTTEYGGGSAIPPRSLWQIGSNTKAFTAAIVLQLEAEHVLSIEDTVGKWLPQYPVWRKITIRQLLNMTSGIASYDEQPAFLADYAADPLTDFPVRRLISFGKDIPLLPKWNYTNTGYQMVQLIIEKATGDTYGHQLEKRLFKPLHLRDMVYRTSLYSEEVTERMPAGYFYDKTIPQFTSLVGMNVVPFSLSWGRSAGGIVGSTEALAKWERALYEGCVLQPKQQKELESVISEISGEPIPETTPADPQGFGLGVQQQNTSLAGIIWNYEGGTFGFRMVHIYLPKSGTVITVGLNSNPQHADDYIGALALSIYTTLHRAGKV